MMDCRICGDPNSYMRFAFIEFQEEESAQKVRADSAMYAAGWVRIGKMATCDLAMQALGGA